MNADPHNGDIFTLCDIIRETSFEIYKYLRSGHREQIYENALAHRLTKERHQVSSNSRKSESLMKTARCLDILRLIC